MGLALRDHGGGEVDTGDSVPGCGEGRGDGLAGAAADVEDVGGGGEEGEGALEKGVEAGGVGEGGFVGCGEGVVIGCVWDDGVGGGSVVVVDFWYDMVGGGGGHFGWVWCGVVLVE